MLKKVAIGAAGLGAFIVAAALVSIISTMVSALIPGRSPDASGELDPPIEQKSKQEYEATLNLQEQPKTNESQNETQSSTPVEESSPPQEASPPQEPVPAPAPVSVAPPAPRSSGPGNFDSPPAPYGGGGIYPSGPGNM
jgi:hypothetical protein